MSITHRIRNLIPCVATTALLGCTSTNTLSLRITNVDNNEPLNYGIARVIPLSTGLVALPINEETLEEILAVDEEHLYVYIDEHGYANFNFLDDRQAIIEIGPSPFSEQAQRPGKHWARFLYSPSPRSLVRIQEAGTQAELANIQFRER